jgi:hypothetical protein
MLAAHSMNLATLFRIHGRYLGLDRKDLSKSAATESNARNVPRKTLNDIMNALKDRSCLINLAKKLRNPGGFAGF